ncbi:MAG: ABC transporter permease subunit [Phaeodactylibacter sp.]|nr:ABC transporter permease subunit [Phaeodactylibacter sp.]MCB9295097.1 ABC transporter permease subunit [Lewinellaceae bacterium]
MKKIISFVAGDILRNRTVLAYTAVLLLFSLGLFSLEPRPEKALLSLMNIVLVFVPLASIVFSTIHYYNSAEFMELVLAQPVARSRVLLVEFAGIALALVLAFLVGVGLPVLWHGAGTKGILLVLGGVMATVVFVALAFLGAVTFRDKAQGIGFALILWFFFALVFDALLLLVLYNFSEYPLERAVLVLTMLNPIDIARMMIITRMDAAALMGHSGAVFREFLAGAWGWVVAWLALLAWGAAPLAVAVRIFNRKDL